MSINRAEFMNDSLAVRLIAGSKRDAENIKVTQKIGPDSVELNWVAGSFTMFPPNNGQERTAIAVTALNGSILHASLNFTFYETGVSAGSEIGYGNARDADYRWEGRLDWGEADPDHSNVIVNAWVRNTTGSPQTVIFRWELRAILSTVS